MPDEPISGLPAVSSPNPTDLVPIEHGASGGPYVTSATTIAELVSASGVSGGVSELNTKTGAVTLTSPDSSVSIGSDGSAITLEVAGGGGGGGVTELNTKTGAVTITSPDDSVTIGSSGDSITLEVSGGGGGGGGASLPATYDDMIQAEPGLIYYWPFSDASGSPLDSVLGRTWVVNGSPTYHAASLLANGDPAIEFPDATANLNFDASIVTRNNVPWTLEFFFKVSSTPASAISLWNQESGSTGFLILVNTSNQVILDITDVGDTTLFTLTPGTPYHFAFIFDGGSVYLWVNGELTYKGSLGYTFNFTASPATIKGGPLIMQKLALYNLALSKARLNAHYQALSSSTWSWPFPAAIATAPTNYDSVILAQSPTHYWPLSDAPSSTTAADLVGSQPLTASGSPVFGAPPLALDGETSVWSSGTADTLVMPEACQPTANFSLSFLCSFSALIDATAWSFGNNSGNFGVGVHGAGNPYVFSILSNLINWYETSVGVSGAKVHVCVTYNAGIFLVYINGAIALDSSSITCTPSTTTGSLLGVPGRMSKAALWVGMVLTATQIFAQVAAAGL